MIYPQVSLFTEADPEAWPAAPEGLSDDAAAIPPAAIWSRLEAWTRARWAVRSVEWIMCGPGEWAPPLDGVTIESIEVWDGFAWASAEDDPRGPRPSPLGHYWPAGGPYRISGTVGTGTAPQAAQEAYRRLAEHLAASDPNPGSSAYSAQIGGKFSESVTRASDWRAMALFHSGAADMLRPYRKLP